MEENVIKNARTELMVSTVVECAVRIALRLAAGLMEVAEVSVYLVGTVKNALIHVQSIPSAPIALTRAIVSIKPRCALVIWVTARLDVLRASQETDVCMFAKLAFSDRIV